MRLSGKRRLLRATVGAVAVRPARAGVGAPRIRAASAAVVAAREAALALMQWARDDHGITSFVVSIAPGNQASQALAAGLGFVRIGSHVDDVDGPEDVLVLDYFTPRN